MAEIVIESQKLTKQFGGLLAVDRADMQVEKGTVHAIIGPNGAGKTTLINMITGMYTITSGHILFQGHRLELLKPWEIARLGVRRTFQNIKLFWDMTILENIILGRHILPAPGFVGMVAKTQANAKIEAENNKKDEAILKFIELFHLRNEVARSLPYGQQRLLELGRALASDPTLLILDEPGAGLNTTEKKALVDKIREIRKQGISTILIDHDIKLVASIADRVTVLNFGKKIAEGTPAEVQSNHEVIEAYLGQEDEIA